VGDIGSDGHTMSRPIGRRVFRVTAHSERLSEPYNGPGGGSVAGPAGRWLGEGVGWLRVQRDSDARIVCCLFRQTAARSAASGRLHQIRVNHDVVPVTLGVWSLSARREGGSTARPDTSGGCPELHRAREIAPAVRIVLPRQYLFRERGVKMEIMRAPSADKSCVLAKLSTLTVAPRFTQEMLPALWNAALRYGIDPVGLVAQSYKETGKGNFGGQVKPQFYNTAGIKVRHVDLFPGITDNDRPLAHQMFPNWEVGAVAHAQHICAYASKPITGELIVDPRYTLVAKNLNLKHWADLGARWAPSPTYGTEIENILTTLIS
jgi:Mannosyl-glycoprotein endo-beta-N-acetylglucosaminidase